jgi:hypothetical protein
MHQRVLYKELLDRRPHRHFRFVRSHYFPVPVIAGAADARHALDVQSLAGDASA